jgi:hypothetical protein
MTGGRTWGRNENEDKSFLQNKLIKPTGSRSALGILGCIGAMTGGGTWRRNQNEVKYLLE